MNKMVKRLFNVACCTAFISCGRKSEKMVITDFSAPIHYTLVSLDNTAILHGIAVYKMEGHTNDAISISFFGTKRNHIDEFFG